MGHFTQKSGFTASLKHIGVLAKQSHYCCVKTTQLRPWMGPPQSPPLSINPPLAHITHLHYLPGRDFTEVTPQSGVRDSALLSSHSFAYSWGCLWLTPRVAGPCPRSEFTTKGMPPPCKLDMTGQGPTSMPPSTPYLE